MLIEEFVRVGRVLLGGDPDPQQMLRLVTDVAEVTVKNFYRNVLVVELPADPAAPVCVLPRQSFGDEDEEGDFVVDVGRASGIPFSLPTGGNPLLAQGTYGLPVYPCYDAHLRSFGESSEGVLDFLETRLERTPGLSLPDQRRQQVADAVHQAVRDWDLGSAKVLGVLVLADLGADGFYRVGGGAGVVGIGRTASGHPILPDHVRILNTLLAARVEEGRDKGRRQGRCTLSGQEGDLISVYCKNWPWALPTWTCPLPHGGDEDYLIESIAVTESCYRELVVGACVFDQLARPLAREVVPEIFSPVDSAPGKEQSQRRRLPPLFGSAVVVPLEDRLFADEEARQDFLDTVRHALERRDNQPTEADCYFDSVVGFELNLDDTLRGDYRVTLVYFQGEPSKGDIHLRATIEDVLPSTLVRLRNAIRPLARTHVRLLSTLHGRQSERQAAYLTTCYRSVPYTLARAYGGGYLWQQLEAALLRRPLSLARLTANAARRLESLVPRWPRTYFTVVEEVVFLLHAREFVDHHNRHLETSTEETIAMPSRSWQELIRAFERGPITEMHFNDLAELGFACGLLVRRFSAWYSAALGGDKDFLRDRVLTFGASLSPEDVWKRAIKGIPDVATRFTDLRKSYELGHLGYYEDKEERRLHVGDFRQRLGVVLDALEAHKAQLHGQRDDFMTGFWSGYSLQGHDRPRKPKVTAEKAADTSPNS